MSTEFFQLDVQVVYQAVDWQQDGGHQGAGHDRQDNHQDRLDCRGDRADLLVKFIFIHLGRFAHHVVYLAGLLADLYHLWHECQDIFLVLQAVA
jgi:hypothetical protein